MEFSAHRLKTNVAFKGLYHALFAFIIWLNWSMEKKSVLIGSLRGPCFVMRTVIIMRWTALELISLICVLENLCYEETFSLLTDQKKIGKTSAKVA